MIRSATFDDIEAIVALGARMHAESRYSFMPFAPELLACTIGRLVADGNGFAVVGEEDGTICALMLGGLAEQWFSYTLMAFEYAVYVAPERRGSMIAVRMLQAFKNWCAARNVEYISLGVTTDINDERAGQFYQRLGFKPVGQVYAMEGSPWASQQ
jgi:GNAT superfamily N-acetyltransferase